MMKQSSFAHLYIGHLSIAVENMAVGNMAMGNLAVGNMSSCKFGCWKIQNSKFKNSDSNFKFQISNFKFQISKNRTLQTSPTHLNLNRFESNSNLKFKI